MCACVCFCRCCEINWRHFIFPWTFVIFFTDVIPVLGDYWRDEGSGGSKHFEGERKTLYQTLRQLSQMHMMDYTRIMQKKATCWKIVKANGGGRPPNCPSPLNLPLCLICSPASRRDERARRHVWRGSARNLPRRPSPVGELCGDGPYCRSSTRLEGPAFLPGGGKRRRGPCHMPPVPRLVPSPKRTTARHVIIKCTRRWCMRAGPATRAVISSKVGSCIEPP